MTHTRPRIDLSLRLSALVLFVASACEPTLSTQTPSASAPPTAPTSSSPPTSAPIAIPKDSLKGTSVDAWYPWFGVEASLFLSQVQKFNSTNDWGIVVNPTGRGSYSQLYADLSSALPSPDRPQLAIALPSQVLEWDADGYVVDLTRYVEDPQYGLTSAEQADFPMVFWSQDEVGGHRLAAPAERSALYLAYNQTWARSLGFPSPPQTSDGFRQQACRAHQSMMTDAIKSNDAQGGWLVDSSSLTFLSWMMAFGGGVLEGNGYRFLTPNNLTALTFVKQLYNDGCAWVGPADSTEADIFAGRQALFVTVSLEQLPDFSRALGSANNGDDWVLLAYPGPVQPGLVVYGSSYVVLQSTPQQQLASWLFVRWLLSGDNQKDWVDATGLFPLRTSELSQLDGYRSSHPQWSEAVDLLPKATIQPQLASWGRVMTMVGDGFDAMFRSNTPPGRVAEILAIMGSTANDLSK